MTPSAQEVLAQIPQLVQAQDAAALVALDKHDDKAVRKAARKAIHALRSKGVAIPEGESYSWTPGPSEAIRGELVEAAMIDVGTSPAVTRILVAFPLGESRGQLWMASLTAFDQVVGFNAYVQTDGQRGRVVKEWRRQTEGREVPIGWARARIRWARERTLRLGVTVPDALNDALIHLGEAPASRPASFLAGALKASGEAPVDSLLMAIGATAWPPLMAVEPFLKRATEANPNMTQETPEAERTAALLAAVAGDLAVRGALQGPIANLLEDAAIGLWLASNDDLAAGVQGLADALKTSEAPESLPWVARLLGLQIAATLAYAQRQQAQGMPS